MLQEKEKTITELKQNLTELKTQNSFLLEELQKTKSEFQKYFGIIIKKVNLEIFLRFNFF